MPQPLPDITISGTSLTAELVRNCSAALEMDQEDFIRWVICEFSLAKKDELEAHLANLIRLAEEDANEYKQRN